MLRFQTCAVTRLVIVIILCYVFCAHCHTHHHHHPDGDNGQHHDHDHEHDHNDDVKPEPVGPPQESGDIIDSNKHCEEGSWTEFFIPLSKRESFWEGMLSTVFIGCAPILCIKFVSTKDYYLKILLSFASGGLMGDVFLHLLPTALTIYQSSSTPHQHSDIEHDPTHQHSGHSHSHNEGYTLLGMHILIGFGIFFVIEKVFHEFGHTHCNGNDGNDDIDHHEARKHAITVINICADASHNFTDGLTIAASFLFSFKMGIIQTFSILLHEIPHEISDYAILIENGVTVKMAMFIQCLTAIACIIGTILGFILENTDIGTKWIIPFTAGGFLYISCVQVLPTLVERKYGVLQSTLHIIFFAIGIGLMIFVGYVEENAETFVSFL